jgi:hypothetical protein
MAGVKGLDWNGPPETIRELEVGASLERILERPPAHERAGPGQGSQGTASHCT